MNTKKHTPISGAEVLQQFEDTVRGKLSDDNWNEDYTAPASFSIREMRDIVRACNAAPGLVEALKEASALLAFLHGAFGNQLKPYDLPKLIKAHERNRAALAKWEGI